MGFAAVVYALKAGLLPVIGVLTPRQPVSPNTPHVPLMRDGLLSNFWLGDYARYFTPASLLHDR